MANDERLAQYTAEKMKIETQIASLEMQMRNTQMKMQKLNTDYLKILGKIELLTEQKGDPKL